MFDTTESKGHSGLGHISHNKSLVIFTLYSLLFISFPILFNKFSPLLIFFILVSIAIFFFRHLTDTRVLRKIQIIISFYAILLILSFILHLLALKTVEPLSYITVHKGYTIWGIEILKKVSEIYLLFPFLLFVGIHLLNLNYKILTLFPLCFIPSLILALYQGLVDINFLNVPYFAELHRASGFGMDSNGMGLSIFLLFPLSIMAILINRGIWKRVLFGMLTLILLWCLFLSGTRSGLIGVLIFIFILPLIWIRSNKNLSRRWRYVLFLSPLIAPFILGGMLILIKDSHLPLSKRLQEGYSDFKNVGLIQVIEKSARYELGLQAWRLTKISPLSGWGPGGFYRNLHNIRFRNGDGSYFRFDNANNHYLQMTSDLGIIGGGLNIFLHTFPLWMVFRIRKRIQESDERLAVGIIFSTVFIMMFLYITGPHTMAISVLWILVVMLCFLFVTALRYGYTFRPINMKFIGILSILTVLFTWGTYNNVFGKEGYKERQKADWWLYKYEKNCYQEEDWPKGIVRWCNKNASLQIPIKKNQPLPDNLEISLIAHNPDLDMNPLIVKYGGKKGPIYEILLSRRGEWKMVEVPVTDDNIFEHQGPDNVLRRYIVLSLDVSRTWVPKEWGVNEDTRELGVAVLIPRLTKR